MLSRIFDCVLFNKDTKQPCSLSILQCLFSGGNFGLSICFSFCKSGEIVFCRKNYYEDFTRALWRLCFNTSKAISLVKNILQTCMVFVNSVLYNAVVNQKDVQHVRYGASFIKKMKNEASMEWSQLQKDQSVCEILWAAQQPDSDVRTLLSALVPFSLRPGRWLLEHWIHPNSGALPASPARVGAYRVVTVPCPCRKQSAAWVGSSWPQLVHTSVSSSPGSGDDPEVEQASDTRLQSLYELRLVQCLYCAAVHAWHNQWVDRDGGYHVCGPLSLLYLEFLSIHMCDVEHLLNSFVQLCVHISAECEMALCQKQVMYL